MRTAYYLTASDAKKLGKCRGQARLIYTALKSFRRRGRPSLTKRPTLVALLVRVGKRLDLPKPINVTASYLTKWKQKGLVVGK